MREIKFRAWIPEKKKFIFETQESAKEHEVRLGTSIHLAVYHAGVMNETLEQFTGLRDKDGQEIYEGDIIQGGGWNLEPFVVEYNQWNCQFHGRIISNGLIYYLVEGEQKHFEVIGNIHENPERLK